MNTTSIIIIILAALLFVWAVYRTVQKFRGKARSSCCGGAEMVIPKKVEDTDESHYPYRYKLTIDGMKCSNCARTVERTLDDVDGVWARVNLAKHQADVLTKTPMDQTAFEAALRSTPYKLVIFHPEAQGEAVC